MRIYDIIAKKRDGLPLTHKEITYTIEEYTNGYIPDYQISALLMAIYLKGMTDDELFFLTEALTNSGEKANLSKIQGIKTDKHSTGGVGDKTTLIVAPIVAACGVKVPKMSGRGLSYTGGTIDKLESIPGFRTDLTEEQFFNIVNTVGCSVISQSKNLTPADKKLYALRDVTATVESIPLIAASIMSKKLAMGCDGIVLDVKTGSGAFMKTLDKSIELSQKMVEIGENAGKKTVAIITNMDIPLGYAIGNSLEVIEAVMTLKGQGPKDLTEISLELAANMLYIAGKGELKECKNMAYKAIDDKTALNKFISMVEQQGGDTQVLYNTHSFVSKRIKEEIYSSKEGYITYMDSEKIGIASVILGAGRPNKESGIDHFAGIILNKKTGDYIKKGDLLVSMITSDKEKYKQASEVFNEAVVINNEKPKEEKLIYARIEKGNTIYY